MTPIRSFAALAAVAALLAACTRPGTQGVLSGDVAVDSITSTRTALLRVQNNYPTEVRVYTVIGGKTNYVAKAMSGETRTWVLDPTLFPNPEISFETRPGDGAAPKVVGPFKVVKGE